MDTTFINIQYNGQTQLMRAVYAYQPSTRPLVAEMVGAGANVNKTSESGFTALMAASKAYNTDAIRVLCESGADVGAVSSSHDDHGTAIDIALRRMGAAWGVAELLATYGALPTEGGLPEVLLPAVTTCRDALKACLTETLARSRAAGTHGVPHAVSVYRRARTDVFRAQKFIADNMSDAGMYAEQSHATNVERIRADAVRVRPQPAWGMPQWNLIVRISRAQDARDKLPALQTRLSEAKGNLETALEAHERFLTLV